jgi:hypothetical protein
MERLEALEVNLHVRGGGDDNGDSSWARGAEGKRLRTDGWGGGDDDRGVGGERDGLLEVVHGGAEESGER